MNETKNKQWEVNFYFPRQKELANKNLKAPFTKKGFEPEYKEREVQRYTLKEYIEFIGEQSAAKLFDCQPSTIKAYRYGKRSPSLTKQKLLIRNTGGKVRF